MNAIQINKMLKNILSDFKGMGRKCNDADQAVIDCLMKFYYTNDIVDFEEISWLFTSYMRTGVLDFSKALLIARLRITKEREVTR